MLRSLTSSWRSLRDRRRIDLLDVIPAPDQRHRAAADLGGAGQPAGAPGVDAQSAAGRMEAHVDNSGILN